MDKRRALQLSESRGYVRKRGEQTSREEFLFLMNPTAPSFGDLITTSSGIVPSSQLALTEKFHNSSLSQFLNYAVEVSSNSH